MNKAEMVRSEVVDLLRECIEDVEAWGDRELEAHSGIVMLIHTGMLPVILDNIVSMYELDKEVSSLVTSVRVHLEDLDRESFLSAHHILEGLYIDLSSLLVRYEYRGAFKSKPPKKYE